MIYDDLILRKKETKFGVLLILNRPLNLLATLRGLLVNTEPYLELPTFNTERLCWWCDVPVHFANIYQNQSNNMLQNISPAKADTYAFST